uniref:Uncharacterized protein n=1 Tax=Tanacetum cinerariifolium TaxID=118510 RepID=A0A6L2KQX1_TANCI|nr:hypothetical protein [Tanacetum cinerariifolium]
MTKLILNEAQTEQYPAEPSIKRNKKYKLGEELLMEPHSNSYSGRGEEDVIGHIAEILEVLDPIEVDGLDPFQLRMITFPFLLSGNARKCSFNGMDRSDINEHIGKVLEITKWIKTPNVDIDEL